MTTGRIAGCVADPGPLGEVGADRLLDDPARRLEPRDAEAAAEVRVRVVLGEHLAIERFQPTWYRSRTLRIATSSSIPRAFHQSGVPFGSSRFECRRLQSTWWPYSWITVCAMPKLRPAGTTITPRLPLRRE